MFWSSGFRVEGSRCRGEGRVWEFKLKVEGAGFRVGFRVSGFGITVLGIGGFRIQGYLAQKK